MSTKSLIKHFVYPEGAGMRVGQWSNGSYVCRPQKGWNGVPGALWDSPESKLKPSSFPSYTRQRCPGPTENEAVVHWPLLPHQTRGGNQCRGKDLRNNHLTSPSCLDTQESRYNHNMLDLVLFSFLWAWELNNNLWTCSENLCWLPTLDKQKASY